MANKKTASKKKAETAYGVFGYTDIRSNSISALSNDYHNEDELRKELLGKPISPKTIEAAMARVQFSKYGTAGVHSFFPDAGKCFVGRSGCAAVVISWTVPAPTEKAVEKLTAVLEKLLEKL
jgi:hypothetical protein